MAMRTEGIKRLAAGVAAAGMACVFAGTLRAQENFDDVAKKLQARAEESSKELAEARSRIEAEKVPLTREISGLEDELLEAMKENERVNKIRDSRTLDLSNLRAELKGKETQNSFLANLIDEYLRNFESVLHISETQRYGEILSTESNRSLNANLTLVEQTEARLKLIELSLDRAEEGVGGTVFPGSAVDESGVVGEGSFILLGPLAYFAGTDESHTGLAETRLGSNEPIVVRLPSAQEDLIAGVATTGEGALPLDATMGNAIKVAETKETLLSEFRKGGAVMYPLFLLAGLSLLIGACKWLQLSRVQRVGPRRFRQIMEYVRGGKRDEALQIAGKVRGPIGKMLYSAVEHYDDPRELVEEMLFEQALHAKTKLNSFLPLIKITAAAAPLLGLLGTVSGMINTFKLIMVFGTGDATTFSAGISEALITTKWGLIVAIPALLLAALLGRTARAVLDDMEKLGVSFMNVLSKEANGASEASGRREKGPGSGGTAPAPAAAPRPPKLGNPGEDPAPAGA